VPLYVGRATEEVLFGRDHATLSTASDISAAGDLAHWLGLHSRVNPALFGSRFTWDLEGQGADTVSQYRATRPVRSRGREQLATAAGGAALRSRQRLHADRTRTCLFVGSLRPRPSLRHWPPCSRLPVPSASPPCAPLPAIRS